MYAITQVNICPATFLKHYFGAGSAPVAIGVASPVVGRTVGFGFCDSAGCSDAVKPGNQCFAQ